MISILLDTLYFCVGQNQVPEEMYIYPRPNFRNRIDANQMRVNECGKHFSKNQWHWNENRNLSKEKEKETCHGGREWVLEEFEPCLHV